MSEKVMECIQCGNLLSYEPSAIPNKFLVRPCENCIKTHKELGYKHGYACGYQDCDDEHECAF